MITVGELRQVLGEMQDHVPVRINVQVRGDARKKHGPWVEDFTVHLGRRRRGKGSSVIIQGYLEEQSK